MCPRHLAPDDPYLRAADLPLAPVHICDALAQVEAGGLWVVDTFDLDEGGVWVGVPLAWTIISLVPSSRSVPCDKPRWYEMCLPLWKYCKSLLCAEPNICGDVAHLTYNR